MQSRSTVLISTAVLFGGLGLWYVAGAQSDAATDTTQAEIASTSEEIAVAAEPGAPAPVAVMVLHSRAQDTSARLVLRGRTSANRLVDVPAETAGLVISEPLRRGAVVEADQLLCKLDPGTRTAQLAEAEARLTEARIEAEAANTLGQKGFAADTTMAQRRAQLQAAEAQADQVRRDISRLEITAPFDGILESDTAEYGSLLTLGGNCATVIDLSQVRITGYVAEQNVDQLSIGQPANVQLINGIERAGEITFISRMADEETRTYAVEVALENTDGRIRDGMTAQLNIDLPAGRAHLIPQTALTLDDNGRLGVRHSVDGIARFAPVALLRDEHSGVWVSGLPEEVSIIVTGQEFVRDGRAVIATPVKAPDETSATQ